MKTMPCCLRTNTLQKSPGHKVEAIVYSSQGEPHRPPPTQAFPPLPLPLPGYPGLPHRTLSIRTLQGPAEILSLGKASSIMAQEHLFLTCIPHHLSL